MDNIHRRDLLRTITGATFAIGGQSLFPLRMRAAGKANPLSSARNCIFIALNGAISHVDCWDFKDTRYTPPGFDMQQVTPDLLLSQTLFPNSKEWGPKVSLVRSMKATELVHFNGQYHLQAGRPFNPAVGKEIPAFGTVAAAELAPRRTNSDTFPIYMSMSLGANRVGAIGSGFFPPAHSGVDIDANVVFDVFGGESGGSTDVLERRYEALKVMSEAAPSGIGSKASEYKAYYDTAYRMLDDKRWWKLFQVSEATRKEYINELGWNCLLAKEVLATDAGCHMIYISDNTNWDNHAYIFDHSRPASHYTQCINFDRAFTRLLRDLESTPGHDKGKTLLDETLVVVTSEFGRVPYMNSVFGRDHYDLTFTSMFVGGGIKPGRILGKTDADGSNCIDTGWASKKQPHLDNAVATIYSALGIDWTKVVENTPSGRAYHYVQDAPLGSSEIIYAQPIVELFA